MKSSSQTYGAGNREGVEKGLRRQVLNAGGKKSCKNGRVKGRRRNKTDPTNHSKSPQNRGNPHVRGLTNRRAKWAGKESPGFTLALLARLRRILPGLEVDVRADLAGAKGVLPAPASPRPAPPGFTFPSSLPAAPGGVPRRQVPTFPPLGGAELPGPPPPPQPPREGAGAGALGGARRQRAPGAAGRGGVRGRRARAGPDAPAAKAPAAAPPRPHAAPPGFPQVSPLTPWRPRSHKPAREEKGKEATWATLPQLPEGLTRRRGDYLRRPSNTLPGDRGRHRQATDTD